MPSHSLSELASCVAETADAYERKSVARQLQHWTDNDLFKIAGLDLGDLNVGRGGVRRYPPEVIPWCVLMYELARVGLAVAIIAQVVTWVRLHELASEKFGHADLFAEAVAGGDTPVMLKVVFMRHAGPDRPRVETVKAELIAGPVTLDEAWGSGVVINLTRAMERTRPFRNEGNDSNVC